MRQHLRPLAMITFLTAATTFGGQLAFAETTPAQSPDTTVAQPGHGHQHHGRKEGHRREMFFKRIAKQLGLSDQQKSQAKAIMQASREENKPLFKAMMDERGKMRDLVLSGNADEAAIRAQSAKVAQAQADLAVKKSQEVAKLRALLTPEQNTKLNTILAKMAQRHNKEFQEHGPMM
ncbi:Spy/CpxP family protein refolding chaperone [Geomonas sp. Red32]|uniref:Spy/CpxP family protein refolding chaperone n=1 Tax=Geomonas sp. Red32 TaxID=2912856 RepID=UPI00202CD683|nr:Spy/CpxP family protein refolding chaperone [Geomonas sp. Red32]MCM0083784.1 Spy/CpxP family protein refolding chaperone [Geomonas sp. Red32]